MEEAVKFFSNIEVLITTIIGVIVASINLFAIITGHKNSKDAKKRGEVLMQKIEQNDKAQDEKINEMKDTVKELSLKVKSLYELTKNEPFARSVKESIGETIENIIDTYEIKNSELKSYFYDGQDALNYLVDYTIERGILNGVKFDFEILKDKAIMKLKVIKKRISPEKLDVQTTYKEDLTPLIKLRLNDLVVELKKFRCEGTRPNKELLRTAFCDCAEGVLKDAITAQNDFAKKAI